MIMSNLSVSGYANARYDYEKAKKSEMRANDFGTAAGVALLTGAGFAANKIAKANPKTTIKMYKAVDKYSGKAFDGIAKYSNKFIKFINKTKVGKWLTGKTEELATKAANTKLGTKIVDKVAQKAVEFGQSSAAKRGKILCVTAGLALLAGGIIKLIRNHDKNEGAIEQKYQDRQQLSQMLL